MGKDLICTLIHCHVLELYCKANSKFEEYVYWNRFIGLSAGPDLATDVHPDVADSATKLSKSVFQFGITSEDLMLKYGKKIVGMFDYVFDFFRFIVHNIYAPVINSNWCPFWNLIWNRSLSAIDFSFYNILFHQAIVSDITSDKERRKSLLEWRFTTVFHKFRAYSIVLFDFVRRNKLPPANYKNCLRNKFLTIFCDSANIEKPFCDWYFNEDHFVIWTFLSACKMNNFYFTALLTLRLISSPWCLFYLVLQILLTK